MNIFKGIFSSKKANESESKKSFREQVLSALDKCKKEKEKEINNISDIKKWAKDIIVEIFEVPTAYWYEEMNEYENIKFHENNLSISERLIKKTDKIIDEYREQIKLSNSKITFCDTLINEYDILIERYDDTIKKISGFKSEERKIKLLNKHKKRIEKMRSGTGNFDKMFEKTGNLELLNDDIENIEEDFKIKQEVTEYIEKLDREFTMDNENVDSFPIRNEINKITEEIKKK